MPFLVKAAYPFEILFRRAQRRINRVKHLKKKRALKRFRRYCEDLPKFVPEPVFVKVGANDGITGDPCSDILLAQTQWKGLLIEPVPYCFERLKANFPDSQRFTLEQVAIGATAGEATFYYVDKEAINDIPDLPVWYDQIGSFDKKHILKHLDGMLEPYITECSIEVYTLSGILKKNRIQDVHLLHIDAEGYDYDVLKSLDLVDHAPLIIFFEHTHLSDAQKTEMIGLLRKHRYCVRDCGTDYLAINEKNYKRLR